MREEVRKAIEGALAHNLDPFVLNSEERLQGFCAYVRHIWAEEGVPCGYMAMVRREDAE